MNGYRMSAMRRRAAAGEAGFTLIEVLMATLLMTVILGALATVTAQWLPNWNRGMARVQRAERLSIGLERALADLSVAEMISMNGDNRKPLFEGSELSVTIVRTAVGPKNLYGPCRNQCPACKSDPVYMSESHVQATSGPLWDHGR